MLEKNNYDLKEKISGKFNIQNKLDDGEYNVRISVTEVYDWYDERIILQGKCCIHNKNLEFEFDNIFEKGLYTIIMIEEENGKFSFGDNINEKLLDAFMVMGNDENPIEIYNKVYLNRESVFNRIKDCSTEKNADLYNVFVFSKNILVSTVAQYDDVQVFPYDYLKCTSEVDYINNFLKDNIIIDLKFKEENFNTSIPSCVYLITNIKADSYDEAEKYAIKKAEIVNNIYSILLKSHGHFFAAVTMNTREKLSRLNIFNTRYKGNLLLFADQGHNVLHYYKSLSRSKSYLNVYIKLLNDAIDEENRMMKYYRYWNILEGISEHYNLQDNAMKRWDGTDVIGKDNKVINVGKESLNKVFELIRLNYASTDEKCFLGELDGVEKVKDFLSICYQRRCCCAHNGEYCINDKNICKKDAEKRCLKYNIIHLSEPMGFQDKILRRIEELVMDLLRIELKRETGESIKEKNIVENFINKNS